MARIVKIVGPLGQEQVLEAGKVYSIGKNIYDDDDDEKKIIFKDSIELPQEEKSASGLHAIIQSIGETESVFIRPLHNISLAYNGTKQYLEAGENYVIGKKAIDQIVKLIFGDHIVNIYLEEIDEKKG